MQAIVQPSTISGTITAPASKSAMQRACAAALIRKGQTILHNPGVSADDLAAIDIIKQLGAAVEEKEDSLVISSEGIRPGTNQINCGESGLSVRMFTSIAAVSKESISVTGTGSLQKRPLDFFDTVLPALGVHCQSNKGLLPLQIRGPLQPRSIEVDGSLSSQFLTGLLMAYSAADASGVSIKVQNLNSKPYIDLTLKLMKDFGLAVPVNQEYKSFNFGEVLKQKTSETFHYTIEGDWSGGAFLLVAGAISGNLVVKGLDVFSAQADRAVLQALVQAGANMSIEEKQIEVRRSPLKAFHFNANDCPDLFPPLVALAAYCAGTSVIEGAQRLKHKESNRAETLEQEFGKMGVSIRLQDDLMIIEGNPDLKGTLVSSNHDHRIAMACAVAALRAEGAMVIEGAEAVNKSYPQFWKHLQQLKAGVSLNNQ